ncbi:MAG: hypothetical protein WB711_12795 [Terriglobales bacterium]
MAGSMWFYVQRVLIRHQQTEAAFHGIPRGNLSDLYPRWLGARELLLHGRDPYSPEVTREIQIGYWGRALDSKRPGDPKDQAGFAYPVFVVFLLWPTIALPFSVVQTGAGWFLLFLTAATVPLWLRALRWRPSVTTTAILIVMTLGSFQAVQGIKVQQLGLLVGGLVAASAALFPGQYFALAGVLLALATIKPQLVLLLIGFYFLWAFSDWYRRHNFAWGFVLTMAILLAAAEYISRGWIWRFCAAVAAYRQYNDGAASVLDLLLTPRWGTPLAGLTVLALAFPCWRFRRVSPDSSAFGLVLALLLAVTVAIVPKAAPYNQVLLLPGILLLVRDWDTLWRKGGWMRAILAASGFLFFWPWLAATGLTVSSLFLPPESVQNAWAMPLWTIPAIPPAIVVVLAGNFGELAKASSRKPDDRVSRA